MSRQKKRLPIRPKKAKTCNAFIVEKGFPVFCSNKVFKRGLCNAHFVYGQEMAKLRLQLVTVRKKFADI